MITRDRALEILDISDQINQLPFQLFKKNTLLIYVGKCRKAKILVTSKGEEWLGKKEIFERTFGYIVDFILGDKVLHIIPKIGDILYIDPYAGELVPFQVGEEMFYFKTIKLDDINLIIR